MRRRQLIEIEDQPWCPAVIRDGATDYLQFVLDVGQPYGVIAPRLATALRRAGASRVVDLCSGGGGPWAKLLPLVRDQADGAPAAVLLTDLYPSRSAAQLAGGDLRVAARPVDATQVPAELRGFRTLFTSFHHFAPASAARILRDAVAAGEGIGIFEVTERRFGALLAMLLVPLVILLGTPAIRPFRWSRLFWTYVLPAIPLVGLLDGTVSCLRSYTVAELGAMAAPLAGYAWEAGQEKARHLPLRVTYLIGVPRR